MAKKKWFEVNARSNRRAADISIFSDIGQGGVTAQDFHESLLALGDPEELRISISSDGGDVSQGTAIFNMLKAHPARKVVTIQGLAASMASVIAMVGDEIIMPKNSMMMIHNPWGVAMGGAEEIVSFGEALEVMRQNIVDAYVDRTGLSAKRIANMMDRETWLSAHKAKELGFADKVTEELKMAAKPSSFDFRKFKRTPAGLATLITKGKTMSTNDRKHNQNDDDDFDFDAPQDRPKTLDEIRERAFAKFNEFAKIRERGEPIR